MKKLLLLLTMLISINTIGISQCVRYISQNSDGAWLGITSSVIDIETVGNYAVRTQANGGSDYDGFNYQKFQNGGESTFKLIDDGSMSMTFNPGVPANEIAFSIHDVDAATFSNNQTYTFQINGGNPNGVFTRETPIWDPPSLAYNETTGIATNDGNDDNQKVWLRGNGTTLITSITVVADNIGGDHIDYSFYALEPCGPTCVLTPIDLLCFEDNTGELDLVITDGTSPFDIDWDGAVTDEDDITSPQNETAIAAGTYTITVTDDDGNSTTCSATVAQPEELTASVSTVDEL